MPELRQDVVTGNWVVVATERAKRPGDFFTPSPPPEPEHEADCPFCAGNEKMTPPELFAVRPDDSGPDEPGWRIRVVPNKFPAFDEGSSISPTTGMFPRKAAPGSHEVIIHSPAHNRTLAKMEPEEIALVFRVYLERYSVNGKDPDVRYVHLIINQGRESGASLDHPHSQLFGVPLVPSQLREELDGASRFFSEGGECVFCRTVSEELEADERVVSDKPGFIAVAPFASRLPFELRVIPKTHQESFDMIADEQIDELAIMVHELLAGYEMKLGNPAYNLYIHTAPCDGSENPSYHWHIEMFPRLTVLGSFELGTSMMINITTPEHAADFLSNPEGGDDGG